MMGKGLAIRMPYGVRLEERFAEGKQKAKDQNGQAVGQVKYFFGYKGHVSMNAESNLITSLEVTSGKVYDGHHFCSLVDQDLAQNIPADT